MRLIDADALIDWLKKPTGFVTNCEDCEEIDCLNCTIDEAIKNAPTIDAEPVRHGRWRSKGLAELECTICKYTDVSKRYSNYCPNCGNPMDGGAER